MPDTPAVPPWVHQPGRGRTRVLTRPDRPELTLAIHSWQAYPGACTTYRARLYQDQVLVAGAEILGPGNCDMASANVLCDVEVRPSHRGQKLSKVLLELLVDELGDVYRTGRFSVSGHANAKNLDLPLVPGASAVVSAAVEYSFVDWKTGSFV